MPPASTQFAPRRLPAGAVLFAALLLALLRFVRLGEWSLWIDESLTWADAHHGLDGTALFNPIGYRLVALVAALGHGPPDEFALRLLPAVIGVACVPVCAWTLAPILGRRRAAWAALFLAVSAWHLFWSQTARFYTLAQLTALIGTGLALRGFLHGGRLRIYLGLIICAGAASFHPSAALLIPGLAMGAWFGSGEDPERRARVREAVIVLALIGLACSPWALRPLLHHLDEKPSPGAVAGPLHLMLTAGYFFTPVLGAAAVWAAWRAVRHGGQAERFLTAMLVTVFGAALLLSVRALLTAQYLFVLLPFACALAASLLSDDSGATSKAQRTEGALIAGVLFASLANCALYLTSRQGERPRWREAYEYVDAAREPSDVIAGMASSVGEFYLGGAVTDLRRAQTVQPLGRFYTDGPRRWRRDGRRTWIVLRPQWFADMLPEDVEVLQEFLRRDCRLMRRFDVQMDGRDLDVLVYLEG